MNFVFRIVFESHGSFRVSNANNNLFPAEITGRLRDECRLTVGDWVEGIPQPGGWVLITNVLERKSVLERKDPYKGTQILAANVDTLFVVTSANQDLSANRLDRYIALGLAGNMRPVILVNKLELTENPREFLTEVALRFPQVDVIGVSVFEAWNLDCLETYLRNGQTVCLVGSSGVGKSTLTNYFLGRPLIATQEVRESDGRGRHTTTHRELHVTESGASIIDTPGIRLVGLTGETEVSSAFPEIEEFALTCKFNDCRHSSEPGCAILAALESGELSRERWDSYLKLGRELDFERRKGNKALQAETKKKWAKINKDNRARMKARWR
jgi:ribosome biogenesis GTPase / thiamine phosphate phosphatase